MSKYGTLVAGGDYIFCFKMIGMKYVFLNCNYYKFNQQMYFDSSLIIVLIQAMNINNITAF